MRIENGRCQNVERKIIITKETNAVWTYLLENEQIAEIHCSPDENEDSNHFALGNIYIGKVTNIVTNIGAAFINIGGINCYYDLSQAGSAFFTHKSGKKELCIGDELLVQISKEAVKTKAPTVSSNISLTGRFAVLTSGNTRIGASGKIPKALREELKEQLQIFKNEEYGIIVRTNAKDAEFSEVLKEIQMLTVKYEQLKRNALYRTCFSCLYTADKSYLSDLKNVYSEGLKEIVVEDQALYEEILEYMNREQPDYIEKVRLHNDKMLPLSKLYSTESIRERALSERVWLKHGGYLIIQPTEALTVVDVNSGKDVSKKKDQHTYLKINIEAAEEIARQIRLRNYSGIILVDFINLDDDELMSILLKEFRRFLSKDPIQTTLVDVTQLQLVEVTRKKTRRPLHEYAVYYNK